MKTNLFSFFLALIASVGMLHAQSSGTCGDNLTWNLTDGVLTISGTGNMYDYDSNLGSTWSYYYRETIVQIVIENGVTSIGNRAFSRCTSLTSVTIPNSVTSIGTYAFSGCTGLTSLTIPNSVTSIGEYAFSSVPNIVYNGSAPSAPWGARSMNGYVEGWLVYSDETKTNIVACSSAATGEIVIPNSVISIGTEAFYYCSSLTSVNIPISVTSIGKGAFYYCSNLTSITIPNSVTSIENCAFLGCSSITSVSIPNSATSIGEGAFYGCSSLTSVAIPNSVTSIVKQAFDGCTMLQHLTLGEGVTTIDASAFANCPYLIEVKAKMKLPPVIEASVFTGCGDLSGITCYVPEGSLAYYQKLDVWKEFNLAEKDFSEEDAIETTNNDAAVSIRKELRDGQLFILREGKMYNVQGQEVR